MWRVDAALPFDTSAWARHVKADMDQRQLMAVAALNPNTSREEVSYSTVVERDGRFLCPIRLLFPRTGQGRNQARTVYAWLVAITPFVAQPRDDRDDAPYIRVHDCGHERDESCKDTVDRVWP